MTGARRFLYRDGVARRIIQTWSRDASDFAFLINRISGTKRSAVRLAAGEPKGPRSSRDPR